MKTLRIVAVSDSNPRLLWRLAQRIESEVPGATICGLIHQAGSSGHRARSAGKHFRAVATQLAELLLHLLHASPFQPNADAQFDRDALLQHSQRVHWQVAFLDKENFHEAEEFVRKQQTDLCVALLEKSVAPALFAIPKLGSVVVTRFDQSLVSAGHNFAAGQPIKMTASRVQGASDPVCIQTLSLPIDPYDTPTSMTLKTDLVGSDLLIQSTARIAHEQGAASEPSGYGSRMLSLLDSRATRAEARPTAHPSPFTRAPWKLFLISVALWPYLLVRNWCRRLRGQFPVIILVHHLISDVPHRMGMSTDRFLRQVQFLRKHYQIVSLSDAVELLKSSAIRVPTVAITFDDGYQENFLTLRSVVEATGLPVSMFVCTGLVEQHSEFPHDLVEGQRSFKALSWEEVAYLGNNGMEIGSHTRFHLNCGSTDEEALYAEIVGAKTDLQQHLRMRVRFFGFPFGEPENISPQAMKLAKSHYEYSLSCYGGENFASGPNGRTHLLRQGLESSTWELELALQGILDLRKRIQRRFGWGDEAQVIERFQAMAALRDVA